jgi:hypothetical protein
MGNIASLLTEAQYQALLTGMPKYCPNAVFTIDGQSYTTTQVAALINAILNAKLAVAPAKATYLAAAHAIEEAVVANGETVKEIRAVISFMFGNEPATLAAFGISPRKSPKPLSTEARAAAEAKAEATRKARGTTGKKQKASIKGSVTGVSITPLTTGTAATSTATSTSAASTGTTVTVAPTTTGAASGTPHT